MGKLVDVTNQASSFCVFPRPTLAISAGGAFGVYKATMMKSTARPQLITAPQEEYFLTGLKAGNPEVFEALFLHVYDDLWRFALSFVRINELAEDTVQDVLLSLWERRNEIEIQGSLASYLLAAVRRHSLRNLRKGKNEDRIGSTWSLDDVPAMGSLSHPGINDSGEVKRLLKEALNNLSPVRRQVLVLRWANQLSYDDIGEIMDMSAEAVRAHVSRAYRTLRKLLIDAGLEAPGL